MPQCGLTYKEVAAIHVDAPMPDSHHGTERWITSTDLGVATTEAAGRTGEFHSSVDQNGIVSFGIRSFYLDRRLVIGIIPPNGGDIVTRLNPNKVYEAAAIRLQYTPWDGQPFFSSAKERLEFIDRARESVGAFALLFAEALKGQIQTRLIEAESVLACPECQLPLLSSSDDLSKLCCLEHGRFARKSDKLLIVTAHKIFKV
jgi:hypothetical protein